MESQVGNFIQDQNVHFKGASAGVRTLSLKHREKEHTFDGSKKKVSGRKALSDISNSKKQQMNEAPKKNMSTKVSVVAEEDLDVICEEGFLHNHEECIKAHTKAMDIDEFLKTVGLKNNDFPMQQSASSSHVVMDDLLSEDEFPWKREEFSDHDSPVSTSISEITKPFHDVGGAEEDTVYDIDIMSLESPNFTLIESP